MMIKKYLTLFFFLVILVIVSSCADPNYQGENYIAFDSMDALVHELTQSIAQKDSKKLVGLLSNQALLLDALAAAKSENAQQLQARLSTEQGRKAFEKEWFNTKSRIEAFIDTGLEEADIQTSNFQTNGMELLSSQPYAQGSPAEKQTYKIIFNDGNSQYYSYQIAVIKWEQKYHLIEADGYLKPQS